MTSPIRPEMPPYPFVPPFDPPGDDPPYQPPNDPPENDGPITLPPLPDPEPPVWPDDYPPGTPDPGPRPPWWPDEHLWPPEPERPVVIHAPPPIHVWPRLPPDHPYHVPPGYSAPDNLPPGHPGEAYPGMLTNPSFTPVIGATTGPATPASSTTGRPATTTKIRRTRHYPLCLCFGPSF